MASIILIKSGNVSDGELDLSDRGNTKADKGSIILWQMNPQSNVDSFEIRIKTDPDDIFSTQPHKVGNQWKATIKTDAPDFAECEYAIPWKDSNGNDFEHDPKIAVKSSI